MSNTINIGGHFGVEIKDKNGNIVDRQESHNIVVNGGVKQIKRWLDRPEYVNNPTDYYHGKRNVPYFAGEERRITILAEADFTDGQWHDNDATGYGIDKMFDGNPVTYCYHWLSANSTEHLYIYLNEGLNLKKMGLVGSSRPDHWGNACSKEYTNIRQECYGVQDAGTTEYNDYNYVRMDSDYNDNPAYKFIGSERYLFTDATKTKWQLSTSLGGAADYETNEATLPATPADGTWVIVNGSIPEPTVTNQNGPNSSANWQYPMLRKGGEEMNSTNELYRRHFCDDPDYNEWYNTSASNYKGKNGYQTWSFEGIEELDSNYTWYGFIPHVKDIRFSTYCHNWSSADRNEYIMEMHLYEAIMHPQNPYALKLGTDDGTILPLNADNTELGAFVNGMKWKVESVSQNGYTVRFTKTFGLDEANDITFKEIGLFGNFDGHLMNKRTEPNLNNAEDLFARSIFDTPWSKTSDQTATIYYEIGVNIGSSSSSSSSSSSNI